MPLISVIIPTYNRKNSISGAIESVLNQSFKDWELIIVDDGSEDKTNELVDNFLIDKRIKYIWQENSGVSAARNKGVSISRGKYLTFLDSDDQVTVDWLQDFFKVILIDENVDLVQGGLVIISPINKKTVSSPAKENKYNVPIPGTFLLKKSLFEKIGMFDERLKYAENTELFIRLEQKKIKSVIVETTNLIYTESLSGGSKNFRNMIDSTKLILEKHDLYLSRKVKHLYEQIIGVIYLRFGNYPSASYHLWKAFVLKPINLKTLLRFFISKNPAIASKLYPVIKSNN